MTTGSSSPGRTSPHSPRAQFFAIWNTVWHSTKNGRHVAVPEIGDSLLCLLRAVSLQPSARWLSQSRDMSGRNGGPSAKRQPPLSSIRLLPSSCSVAPSCSHRRPQLSAMRVRTRRFRCGRSCGGLRLGQGHDPFSANVVWAPKGIDLAWVNAVPGPSVVAYPLTALIGPVATYNVVVLAAPALSAWTAYLLARWITRAFWPSLAAGWIFGFSAYEIGHLVGHLNLVLVFLVPLCALLALQHLAGELATRRFAVLFGVALAGQVLISTEIAVTLLLAGLLFGLLALWRLDTARRGFPANTRRGGLWRPSCRCPRLPSTRSCLPAFGP